MVRPANTNRTSAASSSSNSSTSHTPNDLLNFHYASSPLRQQAHQRRHNQQQAQQHQYQQPRSKNQDRSAARRKASSAMFPLISSADHSFVITRRFKQQYSFAGVDVPVSWSTVRMVRYVTRTEQEQEEERCPICLDSYTGSARITKCGHIFCLTCLIHHVQSSDVLNPYKEPSCPCCSIPLHLDDVRPVEIISVVSPVTTSATAKTSSSAATAQPQKQQQVQQQQQQQMIKFVKLHRTKGCSAPYLPHASQPRRSSPSSAPLYGIDDDATYSKFNYVEPTILKQHLQDNLRELKDSSTDGDVDDMELVCQSLACDFIERELLHLEREFEEESQFLTQFAKPSSGIYQPQPPQLVYSSNMYKYDNDQQQRQQQEEEQKHNLYINKSTATTATSTDVIADHHHHDVFHQDPSTLSRDSEAITEAEQGYYSSSINHSPHNHHREERRSDGGDSIRHSCPDDQQSLTQSPAPPPSSEVSVSSLSRRRRSRGDSIASSSYDDSSTCSAAVVTSGGSMYLDPDEECMFYQALDGTLCFLSAFNMKCLQAEFCTTLPTATGAASNEKEDIDNKNNLLLPGKNTVSRPQPRRTHFLPPPDVVEGLVLEVERVHLTAEVRNRLRFLSHLPLFTDVCFVEISLGRLLSKETKKQFQREFQKRQQARALKCQREQREKQRQLIREQERIHELKSRFPRIDPNDEFFQPNIVLPEPPEPDVLTGENFGPSLTSLTSTEPPTTSTTPTTTPSSSLPSGPPTSTAADPTLSFSQICRRGGGTMTVRRREDEFPALGSSPTTTTALPTSSHWSGGGGGHPKLQDLSSSTWGVPPSFSRQQEQQHPSEEPQIPLPQPQTTTAEATTAPGGKKNKKGKKIVLFSTGGQRGAS